MELMLNWLWQGAVVALAAEAVLAVLPRLRTPARYWLAATAYALVLTLPAMPYLGAAAAPMPALDSVAVAFGPAVAMPAAWWASAAVVAALWIVWAAVGAARLATAMRAVRAAKSESCECPRRVEARLD